MCFDLVSEDWKSACTHTYTFTCAVNVKKEKLFDGEAATVNLKFSGLVPTLNVSINLSRAHVLA